MVGYYNTLNWKRNVSPHARLPVDGWLYVVALDSLKFHVKFITAVRVFAGLFFLDQPRFDQVNQRPLERLHTVQLALIDIILDFADTAFADQSRDRGGH